MELNNSISGYETRILYLEAELKESLGETSQLAERV